MKIKDFGVEMWMNAYENDCTYNLAETCVESLTVEQLLELGGCREQAVADILGMKLTYGAIEGSPRLRMLIAGLYEKQTPENVITAHGAIGANHLVIEALAGPGDEVVSVLPTYQQHYSIPEALGAEVHILPLRSGNAFLPDLDELRGMVNKNTKLICINNPNNPALQPKACRIRMDASTSRRRGQRRSTTLPPARMVAARMGSTLFFAPCMVTSPWRRFPPRISSRLILLVPPDENGITGHSMGREQLRFLPPLYQKG